MDYGHTTTHVTGTQPVSIWVLTFLPVLAFSLFSVSALREIHIAFGSAGAPEPKVVVNFRQAVQSAVQKVVQRVCGKNDNGS